jgi:trigger factor
VQRTLEDVQAQFGTLGEKEGVTVSDGDIVRVRERGQEWDTRADAENPVTNRLVGTKVGTEVEIDTELARGKRVRTKLEVVGLRQVVLPEIDDELAKDAGFDNLDALKADIRAKLAAARAEKRRNLIEARLLDVLVEKTEIPLPEPFVEDLVNEEAEKLKGSLDDPRSSMTFEEYLERRGSSEEALREELCESISVRLRRELVLRRLAMDASIDVDDDELTRLAEADAEASGDDSLRFIGRLKADDRWDDYRRSKVDERVLALLRESAVVKEGKE